ncbi:glycosyltransferase family 4 protein [Halocatena salina]|uniref:Glycosyltransferase family 4 protein n=1 Tax=Halocatena salina TaxID=2934340 RepID=A0A8U0A0E6_9EURY|nr:glycosyltransferase family 4 protein [Halocatena salina]UPM41898.1 glycosyltransferase family 4 protein [Halocatena salina]
MTRVGLLYQKEQYAHALAQTLDQLPVDYTADVLTLSDLAYAKRYDLLQTDELLRYGVSAVGAGTLADVPVTTHLQGWDDYANTHGQYTRRMHALIRTLSIISRQNIAGVLYVTQITKDRFPLSFDRYGYSMPVFDVDSYKSDIQDTDVSTTDARELLTVTNLRYQEKLRGVQTVLDGLQPLFATHDDLRYRIAGGGKQLDELREIVSDYPYADRVSVLGFRDDVPDLLASADLFVYVSYLDSLAMTVLEAEAAGLPVVAGDCGGVPEAVGDAGIVCPSTAEGVSNAVRTLVRNDDLRASFATAGRERMTTHNRRQAHRHIAFWENVLEDWS